MSGQNLLLLGAVQQVISDPDFEYTTLLLPGNGTNGAQNNTFLDSSSNAFSITRNGNTTQGTFSPFSQTGWGVYFNGSSDYISVADSADFTMGSGDFTVQCWVYSTANSGSDQYILGQVNSGGTAAATSFQLYKKATSNVAEAFVYAGATKVATGTAQIPVGQWTHLAMVRDGGTLRLYVNGSQDGTNATLSTTAITDSAGSFSVGRTGDYNGLYFAGYVSNVSVVKGTCLFPSGTTFTPSTTPLSTSTSGQSVLLCQANRFIDTNTATTAKTVTVGSTSSIQAFSPFNPTAAWSAATNGGSGYFDGSGDYLSLADNAAFNMGTGNFTAEFWLYTADQTNSYPGIISASVFSDTGAISVRYDNTGNANKIFIYLAGASPSDPLVTSSAYAFGQWIHVAIVRDSTTALKIYVNGTLDGTGTITSGQVVDFSGANSFYIGRGFDVDGGAAYLAGYISSVRLVKGTAVYTGNFTPPIGPLTAITNTSLLLNFTNAGIYDATSKNDLETVGNAQISTTQSKFGGSSMYFDGTGDYLKNPSQSITELGSGDWTIEFWLYASSLSATVFVFDQRSTTTQVAPCIYIGGASNNEIKFYVNGADRIVSSAISTTTWYHVAIAKYSGNTKLFINGSQSGSTYVDANTYVNNPIYIGARFDATSGFPGYIDDLRITKGIARYTSNFTPPTTAFPLL